MYQKLIIIGRLGGDPETRYAQSGTAITNFSVATTEKWKKDGQPQERTEWHNVVAFARQAEVCGEYLRKGSLVMIEGQLQTDKYEKDGQTRRFTKVVLRTMKMLDTRRSDGPRQDPQPTQSGFSDDTDFEDDIPF